MSEWRPLHYWPSWPSGALGIVALAVLCIWGAGSDLAAAQWMRLRSSHFVVVGDAGERGLRRVAEQVETFREALRRALPGAVVATPVPTTIIVFGSDGAF